MCMSEFRLFAVTQRSACAGNFAGRLAALAGAGIDRIILREKDLTPDEYLALARRAADVCGDKLILHGFPAACAALHVPRLHLPLAALEAQPALRERVRLLGVSVHAPEEAARAAALGVDYVTAGHIFDTGCKPGLPGRGLDFLREVCRASSVPVYAIGGIAAENLAAVRDAGAAGACLMSSLMRCPDPGETIRRLRTAIF